MTCKKRRQQRKSLHKYNIVGNQTVKDVGTYTSFTKVASGLGKTTPSTRPKELDIQTDRQNISTGSECIELLSPGRHGMRLLPTFPGGRS